MSEKFGTNRSYKYFSSLYLQVKYGINIGWKDSIPFGAVTKSFPLIDRFMGLTRDSGSPTEETAIKSHLLVNQDLFEAPEETG
jgi:hypothetical protein